MNDQDLTEEQFQRQVMDYAKLKGYTVLHNADSRRTQAGWPDLTLLRPPAPPLFIELKTEKGRVRPAQAETLAALRASGQVVGVYRPRHWALLRVLLDHYAQGIVHGYHAYIHELCGCPVCREAGDAFRSKHFEPA